jgi:ribosomal-protein-serine acetyltransferase
MNDIQIRLIETKDYEQLLKVIERNRERLLRFFPETSQSIIDEDTAIKFTELKLKLALKREQFFFVIVLIGKSEIIGTVILKNINWNVPKGELAYFIDGAYEGKGITSYAVKWLVNYSFKQLDMEKLFIKVNPNNWGSRKIAMKNGFELEGLLKSEFRTGKGELTDVERYGLVKR